MVNGSIEIGQNQDRADSPITIILADDHPLLRKALKDVLESQPDFRIIAEANDGEEAVKLCTQLKPNVVIMDIGMPKLNGLQATREIKERCPKIIVLVLTVFDDSEHILGIIEAGAAGYLTKNVFGDEVIHAIRGVAVGEMVISPSIFKKIIKDSLQIPRKPIPLESGEKINNRELSILRLAAHGLSNKEIARTLQIGLRTVKSYLSEIFFKLNVGSRTEAVIVALKAGIITFKDLE